MPGCRDYRESDARWARAAITRDPVVAPVPVPLGLDAWVNYGRGSEYELTDPVDFQDITRIPCRRIHDGFCGLMQYEQLRSEKNQEAFKASWRDILSQQPKVAA